MTKTFRVTVEKDPNSQTTSIVLPFDVEKVFGSRARVPVRFSIKGYESRSSIFPMGEGKHYMVINKTVRTATGIKGGDIVTITMERDTEPRVVDLPKDFAKALRANPAAKSAWKKLSYSHQREYVEAIEEAKKPETRLRRIEKALTQLSASPMK